MWMKIGLVSLAALTLGAGASLAGEGGGCGMGMSGCGMAGMNHDQHAAASTAPSAQAASAATQPATQPAQVYACPMHPEVTSDKPGKCPKCGMNLVRKQDQPKQDDKGHDGGHQIHRNPNSRSTGHD